MKNKIFDLIEKERIRQERGINLIASENYTYSDVLAVTGSILTNKYAEGYPGKRYYSGMEYFDEIENHAIKLAKEIFGAEYVNVQPYSGTPANLAVYFALLKPKDKIMSMALDSGGHLSHGHKVTATGKFFKIIQYGVDKKTGILNMDEIEKMAITEKPKLLIAGFSAYSRNIDWKRFSQIAKKVGAYTLADISHISGLVASGVLENPVPHFDIVTTTTHKTLRGPRGAIIMARKKYAKSLARSVFPGIQGGPHENTIGAIALTLEKAKTSEFKKYTKQILANAKTMAEILSKNGFKIISGGTDNHLFLIDLTKQKISGSEAEKLLEQADIFVNKNMIPYDSRKPLDPSGIRIGSSAITTRGMREKQAKIIAELIVQILTKQKRPREVHKIVLELSAKFPIGYKPISL
ncbi:serine hydroxymethyltransferase [Patescibacteria group bacterium]